MSKIVIFTGAGISAESGISTFRDKDGLWENYKIEDICMAGCLEKNRDETIKFYDLRRKDIENKKPTYAHLELKKLEEIYPNDIKIITQNIDDLFEKAGCKNILYLHGFLKEIYCEKCKFRVNISYDNLKKSYNECSKCYSLMRPNIVFFNEEAPKYQDLDNEMLDCEFIVVIGTSGNVISIDNFIKNKSSKIKKSILNNLEKSTAINDRLYHKILYKKASEAIDEITFDIKKYINK